MSLLADPLTPFVLVLAVILLGAKLMWGGWAG